MCIGGAAVSELIAKVLDSLKTKISVATYNNWFKSSAWSFDDGRRLRIEVPNKFSRDWILENYLEVIKFELFKLTNYEHDIYFSVNSSPHSSLHLSSQTQAPPISSSLNGPLKNEAPLPKRLPSNLNDRYTFDHFVVGNSNQFVHAACRAVATTPVRNYNPLFIYGGVGLGKTHLLNAIGIEVLKNNPSLKIIFVTGEHFTNEVINSIRYGKTYELRKKYRLECDLLLIDDVQFIAGKERTMEEFFHTFNALYEARKQIILSSDMLPKDIPNLEERLRSRFGWGLLADIQAPDYETRCAILRKKAELESICLTDDVCQFLATHIKCNVRDLEGALIRISAFASVSKVPMTIDLAKETLSHVLDGFAPFLTIESIQQMVAKHFSLQMSDLKSPRRQKNLAVPRHIAMYLCKKHVKASYPEIGNKFGGKDHTTVLHAFKKISQAVQSDPSIRDNIFNLEKIISQQIGCS